MRSDRAKSLHITFRAERRLYWGLKEMSGEIGIPLSVLVYWLCQAAVSELALDDLEGKLRRIKSSLSAFDERLFVADVYKYSDKAYSIE